MDRWKSLPVECRGGLIQDQSAINQGTNLMGSATILENFEPALEGGYKRILGYAKFSDTQIPGSGPVLGLKVALGGTVGVRYNGTTSYDIYFGSGSSWTKINTANRTALVNKARGILSYVLVPAVIIVDGANPAIKWDGTSDTLINGTGAPTDPKYAAVYKNRLVLGGYSSDPQEISISEPNTDIAFNGGSGAMSLPCYDNIVGLKTFREELFIYCENSIWKLTGSTSADFTVVNVTNSIGCISGDTIQELGGDLVFLAPDGFRSTAATTRIGDVELGLLSKAIQPTVREELSRALDADQYSGITIRGKSQYRLYVNQDTIPMANQIGFLGKLDNRSENGISYEWSTLRGIQPYCADSAYTNNQEYCVFGSNINGFVYRLEQGNSFDGSPIEFVYRSPDLTFGDKTLRKVYQKIEIDTQIEGDMTTVLNMYIDREAPGVPQPSSQLLSSVGSVTTYGVGEYGSTTYGVLQYPLFKRNLVGSGFVAAFQFTGSGIFPPFRIDSFTVIFAPKSYR